MPHRPAAETATWLVVAALVVAIVLAPLLLGATDEWIRCGLEAGLAATMTLAAMTVCRDRLAIALPLVAAATLCLQLVPLPDRLLGSIAPISAAAWKVAHQGLGGEWGTISLVPASTATGLRRMFLGLATVAMVSQVARSPRHGRVLAMAVAVSAAIILVLGFCFPYDADHRAVLGVVDLKGPIKWWLTPLEPPVRTAGVGELTPVTVDSVRYLADDSNIGSPCGPYIYSNHFAGGVGLTLPLLLAAALAALPRRVPTWGRYQVVVGLAAAGLYAVAILARSRGGGVALVAGLFVFTRMLAVAPRWRRLATVALAAYIVVVGIAIGMLYGPLRPAVRLLPPAIQTKLASVLADPRVGETDVATRMIRGSPLLGTGINSYEPMNAKVSRGRFVSYYAHNDYAQLFAETGMTGGLIVAVLGWLLVRRWRSEARSSTAPGDPWHAGIWASVAAFATHAFFDWNLHLPANALLATVTTGLALGTAGPGPTAPRPRPPRSPWTMGLTAIFVAACLGSGALLGRDAVSDRAVRTLKAAIAADRASGPSVATGEGLARAIAAGERQFSRDPRNWRLALALGQAGVHFTAKGKDPAAGVDGAGSWFTKTKRLNAVHHGSIEKVPPPALRPPQARFDNGGEIR